MNAMTPKMHAHHITKIEVRAHESSKGTFWRDVVFHGEDGTTFEVTSFPAGGKNEVPVLICGPYEDHSA